MGTEEKKTEKSEEELAVYEKLRQKVTKTFSELHEKINSETISHAMEKALDEITELGEHSKEAISGAGDTLKKDITSTVGHGRNKLDEVTEDAKKHFTHWRNKGGALWHDIADEAEYYKELSRDKSGSLLLHITKGLAEWSHNVSERLDTSLVYKTGEITHGGEFVCTHCEGKIHLKNPGRLPPCPKCRKVEFRRT